jgi:uncharacterized protein YqgV (UPF0045/DUF77 family)
MNASVEISMYPLDKGYGTPILKFIDRLRQHEGLVVETNNMSTQMFGDYDLLMSALTKEMKRSFEEEDAVVVVIKAINMDLK